MIATVRPFEFVVFIWLAALSFIVYTLDKRVGTSTSGSKDIPETPDYQRYNVAPYSHAVFIFHGPVNLHTYPIQYTPEQIGLFAWTGCLLGIMVLSAALILVHRFNSAPKSPTKPVNGDTGQTGRTAAVASGCQLKSSDGTSKSEVSSTSTSEVTGNARGQRGKQLPSQVSSPPETPPRAPRKVKELRTVRFGTNRMQSFTAVINGLKFEKESDSVGRVNKSTVRARAHPVQAPPPPRPPADTNDSLSMSTALMGLNTALISASPRPCLSPPSLPPGGNFPSTQFRPDVNENRPLRLLSLDGGGVRGISSLRILKDIMDRIEPGARPCEYFDLIAGTSTGGLIAIMLGRLRMSVDECIHHYHRLAKHIFKRNSAAQAGSLVFGEHRFSSDNLEQAIQEVVAKLTPLNTKMADHHQHDARTFVLAVRKDNLNNHAARRIRTYPTQRQPADTCEIWEAGRATSAAPSYFPPIKLKDEHGQLRSYIDGGLGYNNPGKELLYEARDVFGAERPIGCFLSIGTGRDRNTGFQDVRNPTSAYHAFKAIALSSEQADRDLEKILSETPGVYYRFNAGARLMGTNGDTDFAKQVALEDWHKMDQVENSTAEYLGEEETARKVGSCAEQLVRITRDHN